MGFRTKDTFEGYKDNIYLGMRVVEQDLLLGLLCWGRFKCTDTIIRTKWTY